MAFLDDFSLAVYEKIGRSAYYWNLSQQFPHVEDEEILLFVCECAFARIDLSPYVGMADTKGFDLHQLHVIAEGLKKGLDVSVYAKEVFSGEQMSEILSGLEMGVDVTKYAKPMFSAEQMEIIRIALSKGIDLVPYIKSYAVTQAANNRKTISNNKLKSLSYCLEHDMPHDDIDYWLNKQNVSFERMKFVVDAYNVGISLSKILLCAENKHAHSIHNWKSYALETIVVLLQNGVDVKEHVSESSSNLIDIIFDISNKFDYSEEILHTIQKGARRGIALTKIPFWHYYGKGIVNIIVGMMDGYALDDIVLR